MNINRIKRDIKETFRKYGADRGIQINANRLHSMLIKGTINQEEHRALRAYNRERFAAAPKDR